MANREQEDEAFANNPHTQRYTLVDNDSTDAPKPPLDLTDKIVKWALSEIDPSTGEYSTDAILEKTSDNPGEVVIIDALGGVVDVNIEDEDTAALSPNDYHFELEVFDDAGENGVVVADGVLTLFANVVNT